MVTAVAVICWVETYVFYNICIEGCQGQGYKDFVPSYLNSAGFLEWTQCESVAEFDEQFDFQKMLAIRAIRGKNVGQVGAIAISGWYGKVIGSQCWSLANG
jgi:hypothetical protein